MQGGPEMEALFLFATEAIVVTNDRGVIIRVNPSAEKLFGYTVPEMENQPVEMLIPSHLKDRHIQHRTKYSDNPHARSMGSGMELYAKNKEGKEIPVEISLSPYSLNNKNYVIAFVVDITLRKQAEDKLKTYSFDLEKQVKNRTLILEEAIEELEKTKEDLHKALEKEKELNELKSRFVSMASHEFRTPLTTMMSSLSLVTKYGDQNDKENQMKHVRKIKKSINTLTDILNDFLSVSRLEEGKAMNVPEDFNLKTFVADIIGEMQAMAHEGQKLIQFHSGGEQAFIDRKLLKNILFNLISNAIKFSPENGRIEVSSLRQEHSVTITVTDNGIGISKADQVHLFERFFRGNNATHIQGTGLGLNIVSKLAEQMGATIHLESEENKGTKFIIIIPQ